MTLVPIIYTSLLIFSCFLLFVIIVSYISYKTKSREQVFSRQVKVVEEGFLPLSVEPAFINNNNKPKRQIPVRITHSNSPAKFKNSTVNRKSKYDSYSNSTHTIKNRIEILNHTENFKHSSTEDDYEAGVPSHFSDHSEINLLNFYSDIPTQDFVTLTAERGSCDV